MAKTAALFLAEGFEEVEAVAVYDLLKRAGVDVLLVGLVPLGADGQRWVTSARGLRVCAGSGLEALDPATLDLVCLPGGNPGTQNLGAEKRLGPLVRAHFTAGRLTAAICAAPTLLGGWGLLAGRTATCYPGLEAQLAPVGLVSTEPVVVDGNLVTSRGMGTSVAFGLRLVGLLVSPAKAEELARAIVHPAAP